MNDPLTGLLTQTAAGSVPIFNTYNSSMELTGIYAEETLNIGYTYNSYTHLRTGMSYGDGQWSYQYDYHHYLASATLNNQPVTQLTYDQIGNRLTCNNTHYRPNACNQYEDLSYDSDGNMAMYDGWALTWNGENRLIRMIKGTAKLEFAYDYMGRRYEKKVYNNNNLTKHQRFIYDGYKLIEIRDALNNNVLTHSFVWRKVPQDVPYSMTYGNTTYYYITDANKNVVCLLSSYSIDAYYQYGPWGEIRDIEGTAAYWNPFRFSSEYYDEETGLVYYNYRYYSPALGRWLSRDPIGEEGGGNLYVICNNNLIQNMDLLGLYSRFDSALFARQLYNVAKKTECIKVEKYAKCMYETMQKIDKDIDEFFSKYDAFVSEVEKNIEIYKGITRENEREYLQKIANILSEFNVDKMKNILDNNNIWKVLKGTDKIKSKIGNVLDAYTSYRKGGGFAVMLNVASKITQDIRGIGDIIGFYSNFFNASAVTIRNLSIFPGSFAERLKEARDNLEKSAVNCECVTEELNTGFSNECKKYLK